MIRVILIIGIGEICQTTGLSENGMINRGHFFNEASSDEEPANQDNGFIDAVYEPDSKNSASSWDYLNPHGFNHISESPYENQPVHGLEKWLTDIIIGKDPKGLIKPIITDIGYPVYKDYKFEIPYPQIQETSQPYPILVPMLHPMPYEVIKTIVKTVEKKIPTPIEKIVPVPHEVKVPYEVVRYVPEFTEKKIPIKIPVYKTIHHKVH